eukprot:3094908-Alexandrium_andersonii.AAC.1
MSASLVGSEMCIRDRPPLYSTALAAAALKVPSAAEMEGNSATQDLASVSYTHLTLPTICSV